MAIRSRAALAAVILGGLMISCAPGAAPEPVDVHAIALEAVRESSAVDQSVLKGVICTPKTLTQSGQTALCQLTADVEVEPAFVAVRLADPDSAAVETEVILSMRPCTSIPAWAVRLIRGRTDYQCDDDSN